MKIKRCNHNSFQRQQGVVIVIALFFVALVATMSYYMMGRLERDTRRTQLLLRDVRAELYAQGSIDWAIEQLKTNLEKQKPNLVVDHVPIQSPVDKIDGYEISSVINDAQARFNLNTLTLIESQKDFLRLIKIINPEMTDQKISDLILAILDWLTPGQQQNEYNKYYLSLSPPYRAAHRQMESASELQLVKGMTPALFNSLQKYIIALPTTTLINVQTASPQVFAAMSDKMTLETALAFEKIRATKNISSLEIFSQLDLIKNHPVDPKKFTVISNFFLIETTVKIEEQYLVLYTLVERTGSNDKSVVRIVWQSKGIMG